MLRLAKSTHACTELSRGFQHGSLGPHVRRQDALTQADARRRHLHELVVVDELNGLLETELARRHEANGFVGRRRAHVGLFLFLRDVHVHVGRP